MTDHWYGKPMSEDDAVEFLNDRGTGVLCLAAERRAYGVPVAFAYDSGSDRVLFDLGFAAESKKRSFIERTDEVCLTVYEHSSPHEWRSVVVTGPLEGLAEDDVDEELESWFYTVAGDVDVEETDLELQWYELRADDVSGRYLG
ncbi:pyridoxamine 5'-phosphate oxidase family protein [Natronobeatus ordinarius]|uniref:pyridoxamine 5'-phosphate oxidase family protein n=1 Tax=Natronobeatus ordinarius TaxID=2963433 RepID=UPI0020CC5AB7|nr:pyridoxamine 5'-phosphate oxidase family protein [Natronobeatus ordinarius]